MPQNDQTLLEKTVADQWKILPSGLTVIVRKTRGHDIDAACGQLVGEVIDRTKRTMKNRMQQDGISVKMV